MRGLKSLAVAILGVLVTSCQKVEDSASVAGGQSVALKSKVDDGFLAPRPSSLAAGVSNQQALEAGYALP